MIDDLEPSDLLDAVAVCEFFGGSDHPIDLSTLYRGIQKGIYPKPIKVAGIAVRWLRPELRAARAAMIAARDKTLKTVVEE
jgi:predicted DNA-binding transcriptional regulator AlpA